MSWTSPKPHDTQEVLYPNFQKKVFRTGNEDIHWITNFPFHSKGKRRDDIVSFGSGSSLASPVVLNENPLNTDAHKMARVEYDRENWNELVLRNSVSPSSCTYADVSGDGFHDFVMTEELNDSRGAINPYGGRVCWLENFGTDEGGWTCREIGRFPGLNIVKVGHFTTTFSLQILATVQSFDLSAPAPVIIFTKPTNPHQARYWLTTVALENTFKGIRDCLVIKSTDSGLDRVIISSAEGLHLVWYSNRLWNCQQLQVVPQLSSEPIHIIRAGRVHHDTAPLIVTAQGPKLILLLKAVQNSTTDVTEIFWSSFELENFTHFRNPGRVLDIICGDFDNDGVDEIIISVIGSVNVTGLYFFDMQDEHFVKTKIDHTAAIKLTLGRFNNKSSLDFASISYAMPRAISIHSKDFISSQITPRIESSLLMFYIPRSLKFSEADILDIAGRVISLVLLPPDAVYHMPTDGTEAVKVLYGCVGWMHTQSAIGLVERTRAACRPGCVASMLVDSPDEYVCSGSDGAVFLRMRPSRVTTDCDTTVLNVLPSYFPSSVCEHVFSWSISPQRWTRSPFFGPMARLKLYHFPGFRIRFRDQREPEDIVRVNFYSIGQEGSIEADNSRMDSITAELSSNGGSFHSVRACLSNPTGDGGFENSISGKRTIIPVMHESGPMPNSAEAEGEGNVYSWAPGRRRFINEMKGDVWVSFNFSSIESHSETHQDNSCTIS